MMPAASEAPAATVRSRLREPRNGIIIGIVAALVAVVVAAMVLLWPTPEAQTAETGPVAPAPESAVSYVTARVVSVSEIACHGATAAAAGPGVAVDSDPASAASAPSEAAGCTQLRVELPIGKRITVDLDELRSETVRIHPGDRVKLASYEASVGGASQTLYTYYDQPRGGKMIVITLIFMLLVIAVARWRGALALVGVIAAVGLLGVFVLPAILAGSPPLLVTVVGATGIMILVLYLAHGLSHRTTAALFGSVFGILFTAGAGWIVTRWLGFSGIAGEEDAGLLLAVPGLQMSDILTATMVIAGLGVLNDITVAQASGVWEMRALNPGLSKRRIFQSAMRMGRDHIASSIYTLVFAYTGAMCVVLLLLYTSPQNLTHLFTTERIAQEIIRTLVGAAGLVLSMPVTTGLAVLFAPAASGQLAGQPGGGDAEAAVVLPSGHGHRH